ncbi:hypothetical protein ERICIV_01603 [Paenibacillus larvae subsp. larvae]|uniref:Uncharacterized protein n=2 Tax=Paenibacillus larvae TaxID=1464 RepID=A0A2L1TYS4_9BACL|nr:hypothetical protein [Paenibacillus larvae]AQZ47875.1 hypothetical protein B5S25_16060 [Paenibacillus larvae subsp. pulvifaciens]AVF25768.1 hypothetical protein ERICIII_01582 [Paenibacillus larvae subsp. larvae]AVF30545.1 hypothetical protein ERICIV_01603 [Paenibacillus larvae subsp. larvae]MCY7519259.1 hypothetical protein [Paenibacillus larvae]MCY9499478.1 hypothetical protein [Paenibacillus larvae]
MTDSTSILPVVSRLSQDLSRTEAKWLLGGSCALLLQRVEIGREPRDIDIYIDEQDALLVYEALRHIAVDKPVFSTTPIYRSELSHYSIENMQAEVVAGFEVQAEGSIYKVESRFLYDHIAQSVAVGGAEVRMMPLAHEFLFNILRNRPDRYQPIAEQINRHPGDHIPAFRSLISRNHWAPGHLKKVESLLRLPVHP